MNNKRIMEAMYKDATISVVIPTLNESRHIVGLVNALNRQNVDQIIIADGGSADETLSLVNRLDKVVILQTVCGRGGQIASALEKAHGDIVWILHADCQIPTDAVTRIGEVMRNPKVAMGCFRLAFDHEHPLLSLYGWFSRFETVLTTFGDQGFFMRRKAITDVVDLAGMKLFEDVVLRKAMRCQGRIYKIPVEIITSARRFHKRGILRTQIMNLGYLIAYMAGACPSRLAERYYHGRDGQFNRELTVSTPKSTAVRPLSAQ